VKWGEMSGPRMPCPSDEETPPRPPSLEDFEDASAEEVEALPPDMRCLVRADRAAQALAKVDLITAELTNEVALTEFDKSDWGPGPWQSEPDLLMWRAKAPPHYRCQVSRNYFGSLNGYVAIPPGHPAHGIHFRDARIRGLPSHRGFTWAGEATAGHWVLGFDCGHGFDTQPASNARARRNGWLPRLMEGKEDDGRSVFFREHYRDLPYLRAVVEALAAALGAIESAGDLPPPWVDPEDDEPSTPELEP